MNIRKNEKYKVLIYLIIQVYSHKAIKMESYLLELLRDKQLKDKRNESFGIYACFFHLGGVERADTRLSSGEIHKSSRIVGFQYQHMQKSMHSKNCDVSL